MAIILPSVPKKIRRNERLSVKQADSKQIKSIESNGRDYAIIPSDGYDALAKIKYFDLTGHSKARRTYGWSRRDGKHDEGERFVTVLGIPPVESALTAVCVSIVADG